MSKDSVFEEILSEKSHIHKLLIVAIFLSFGIGLIANNLTTFSGVESSLVFYLGITISILASVYLLVKILSESKLHRRLNGFFIYNTKTNSIEDIPRYTFAYYLQDFLYSAMAESEDLKKDWENETLGMEIESREKHFDGSIGTMEEAHQITISSFNVVRELIEYIVLYNLSTTLLDYFQEQNISEKNLKTFSRSELSSLIKENRFLEIFTKPLSERTQFTKSREDDSRLPLEEEYIHTAWGADGTQFHNLRLVLPKNSKVERLGLGHVKIETSILRIEIIVEFNGYGFDVSKEFFKYYLKLKNLKNEEGKRNYYEYACSINIKITFKSGFIFSGKRTNYSKWVTEFLKYLEEQFSREFFFSKIGWETVETFLKTTKKSEE